MTRRSICTARWKRSRIIIKAAASGSASCAPCAGRRRPLSPAPSRWRRQARPRTCGRGNRSAELLDRLAYEPGRNNKLRLITAYFREVGDPDRGYALAALTGALSFKHAKPGLIRDLIGERTDPVLFGLSYDYVGDLSETVALMWPKTSASPACGGG